MSYETAVPSPCNQHPDVPAATSCGECQKPLCAPCAVFEGGSDRCQACLALYWRAQKIRWRMLAALGGGALVGGGILLAIFLSSDRAARPVPTGDHGPQTARINLLRIQSAQAPCDGTKALEYVQALFNAQDMKGTALVADDFISRCGKATSLRQLSYSARMRLSEFDLAIRDATELIESSPNNVGYWIWRGVAHEGNGNPEKALDDFQHAFSLQPDQPYVANQLASAYERLYKPCEALGVLRQHLEANPAEKKRPEMRDRIELLEHEGQCQARELMDKDASTGKL
jgi:tetratricopeptide (TPR) repeat protein